MKQKWYYTAGHGQFLYVLGDPDMLTVVDVDDKHYLESHVNNHKAIEFGWTEMQLESLGLYWTARWVPMTEHVAIFAYYECPENWRSADVLFGDVALREYSSCTGRLPAAGLWQPSDPPTLLLGPLEGALLLIKTPFPVTQAICQGCGIEFNPLEYFNPFGDILCSECEDKPKTSLQDLPLRTCEVCGQTFRSNNCQHIVCSPACWQEALVKPIHEKRSKRGRFIILERDEFKCFYCGASDVQLEVDHIVPRAEGGKDIAGNLVTSCRQCNGEKSANRLGCEDEVLSKIAKRNRVQGINPMQEVKL